MEFRNSNRKHIFLNCVQPLYTNLHVWCLPLFFNLSLYFIHKLHGFPFFGFLGLLGDFDKLWHGAGLFAAFVLGHQWLDQRVRRYGINLAVLFLTKLTLAFSWIIRVRTFYFLFIFSASFRTWTDLLWGREIRIFVFIKCTKNTMILCAFLCSKLFTTKFSFFFWTTKTQIITQIGKSIMVNDKTIMNF